MFQRVDRVIGGAHHAHVHALQDAARAEIVRPEHIRAGVVNLLGGFGAQQFSGNPEVAFEFQVGPVVERVAKRPGHGGGPGLELVRIARVPGDQALGDAVGPHGAPLVVIAAQPDVGEVLESPVRGNLGRREVTVVIEDRHPLGEFMVQGFRRRAVQQEILGQERLHNHLQTPLPCGRDSGTVHAAIRIALLARRNSLCRPPRTSRRCVCAQRGPHPRPEGNSISMAEV